MYDNSPNRDTQRSLQAKAVCGGASVNVSLGYLFYHRLHALWDFAPGASNSYKMVDTTE
jgi:hypothetical protein